MRGGQAAPHSLPPVHPGEILSMEFLAPLHITQYRLSMDIAVPPRRINEIVLGKRGFSADTALRLSHYFATSAEFWLNLQMHYELERARRKIAHTLTGISAAAKIRRRSVLMRSTAGMVADRVSS